MIETKNTLPHACECDELDEPSWNRSDLKQCCHYKQRTDENKKFTRPAIKKKLYQILTRIEGEIEGKEMKYL